MVKISSIYKGIIFITTLIMLGCFQLLPKQIIGGYTYRFFVAAIGIILATSCSFIKDEVYVAYKKSVDRSLIPYSICCLISSVYTVFEYNYTFRELILAIMPYLFVFYAYPILYIIAREKDKCEFMSIIANMVTFFIVIKFFSWIFYNRFGINIFHQIINEYGEGWVRNGAARISSGYLFGIALSYYIACFFNKTKKLLYAIIIIAYLMFVVIVTASRFQFVTVTITAIISFYYSNNSVKSKIKKILLLVLVLAVVVGSPIFFDFIDSFRVDNSTTGGSTYLRIVTIEYFWNYITTNNRVLGTGLLVQENTQALNVLTMSQWKLYYLEDVGLLGGVFRLGILFLGIYCGIFGYAIKAFISTKDGTGIKKIVIVSMVTYFIISNIISNSFDLQRAYDVPFYLAFFIWGISHNEEKIV